MPHFIPWPSYVYSISEFVKFIFYALTFFAFTVFELFAHDTLGSKLIIKFIFFTHATPR